MYIKLGHLFVIKFFSHIKLEIFSVSQFLYTYEVCQSIIVLRILSLVVVVLDVSSKTEQIEIPPEVVDFK